VFGRVIREVRALMADPIKAIKETFQEDSPRNFVDHYIKEMNAKAKTESSFNVIGGKFYHKFPTYLTPGTEWRHQFDQRFGGLLPCWQ